MMLLHIMLFPFAIGCDRFPERRKATKWSARSLDLTPLLSFFSGISNPFFNINSRGKFLHNGLKESRHDVHYLMNYLEVTEYCVCLFVILEICEFRLLNSGIFWKAYNSFFFEDSMRSERARDTNQDIV